MRPGPGNVYWIVAGIVTVALPFLALATPDPDDRPFPPREVRDPALGVDGPPALGNQPGIAREAPAIGTSRANR